MRFLLFNLAVVAALFYLFNADRSSLDMGKGYREDPLQTIRQELAALARDIADGHENTQATAPRSATAEKATAEKSKVPAQKPQAGTVDPGSGAPASTAAETAGPDVAPALAEKRQSDPQQGTAVAVPTDTLPPVEDPAVARRRAEVLDGALPEDDGRGESQAEAGPPMSPEERLRKLYSLAEEMELLYVRKTTR